MLTFLENPCLSSSDRGMPLVQELEEI